MIGVILKSKNEKKINSNPRKGSEYFKITHWMLIHSVNPKKKKSGEPVVQSKENT